jgi:hypothetical protein
MHTVWKSRGRVHEVFAKFGEGGYIGVVKISGGGYTFLVFYCIFINKFCKNFGGRIHFYPPSPPKSPPPVCMRTTALTPIKRFNKTYHKAHVRSKFVEELKLKRLKVFWEFCSQISSANSSSVSQSFTLEEIEVKMKKKSFFLFFGLLYCKSFFISTFWKRGTRSLCQITIVSKFQISFKFCLNKNEK